MGCNNKVTNEEMVRASVLVPFMALCDQHMYRFRRHHCCAGCGQFCTQVCVLAVQQKTFVILARCVYIYMYLV